MNGTVRGLAIAIALFVSGFPSLAQEGRVEPTQNPEAAYRLFSTQNIYTFLKLDTRGGQIWQVQWGDKDHRFVAPLNLTALVSGGKPGRFTLYPTRNIYTFVLLDQETGDAWHVQWGTPDNRFIVRIE